jgi:RNA polymerase sigma-70 factor (ECF subfamily)
VGHPKPSPIPAAESPEGSARRNVVSLRAAVADDAAVARAASSGSLAGRAQVYDRYARHVRGVLVRLLGVDSELDDLIQEVFVEVLDSLPRLQDPTRLKAYLTAITVHVARARIRRATRHRWLTFWAPENLPELPAPEADETLREAMRATYAILHGLPTEERIAFTLRYLQGMELVELADACGVSLSTCKRRMRAAERRFMARARGNPALRSWVGGGAG